MKKAIGLFIPLCIQLLIFLITLVYYYFFIYGKIERTLLKLDPFLVEYLGVYCLSIIIAWFIFLARRRSRYDKRYLNSFKPLELISIPIIFLILSTIFVSPVSFIFLFRNIRENILLHLLILSFVPYLFIRTRGTV